MVVVAGIDVSKVSLEVWVDDGPAKRFDNSTVGITMAEGAVSLAVYERRQLAKQLDEAGLSADMVHPNKVRYFARAHGFEAKTVWTLGFCRCLARCLPRRTRRGVKRIRSGPNCGTCCGAGVSWSTSGRRNSTGWIKGRQKAARPLPNGT